VAQEMVDMTRKSWSMVVVVVVDTIISSIIMSQP
jgi:hypothetical protein